MYCIYIPDVKISFLIPTLKSNRKLGRLGKTIVKPNKSLWVSGFVSFDYRSGQALTQPTV